MKRSFKKFLASTSMGICALAMPFAVTGCMSGDDINVRFQDNYFQWQVEGDDEWNNLITIEEIKDLLGEGYKGDSGAQGVAGVDGREVEFQTTETHIQWRYKTEDNSDTWKNLVALSELKGEDGQNGSNGTNGTNGVDGREVEFQTTDTHIQWRYKTADNSDEWKDLVELSTLKGDKGETGATGAQGENGEQGEQGIQGVAGVDGREVEFQTTETHIQWRYKTEDNSDTWKNLVALSELKGEDGQNGLNGTNGTNGVDGREVEFQTTDTHIQWRYETDDNSDTWKNLVELSALKGEKGDTGATGETGKSAYEIYCSYKPFYRKNELQWMNDLVNGKVVPVWTKEEFDNSTWSKIVTGIRKYINNMEVSTDLGVLDIYEDGQINMIDYNLYMSYMMSNVEINNSHQYKIGDINMDNVINEDDYNTLVSLMGSSYQVDKVLQYIQIGAIAGYGNDDYSKILLRDYLDGKIDRLDKGYTFVELNTGLDDIANPETFYLENNAAIGELPALSHDKYTFDGWYTTTNGEFTEDSVLVTNDMLVGYNSILQIRAKWSYSENASQNLGYEFRDGFYTLTAVAECTDETLTIPNLYNGIEVRELDFFARNSQITKIIIPASVTKITRVLAVTNLEDLVVEFGNPVYDNRNNCNAVVETATNKLVVGAKNTVIDSSIDIIGERAFQENSKLTSIVIPEGVHTIEAMAFYGCENLETVSLPNTLIEIYDAAFASTKLKCITIPENVTLVDDTTFFQCASLESIIIDSTVISNSLYSDPPKFCFLDDCYGLTNIYIKSGLDTTNSTYLIENFTKQDTSDKDGYDQWVKNS